MLKPSSSSTTDRGRVRVEQAWGSHLHGLGGHESDHFHDGLISAALPKCPQALCYGACSSHIHANILHTNMHLISVSWLFQPYATCMLRHTMPSGECRKAGQKVELYSGIAAQVPGLLRVSRVLLASVAALAPAQAISIDCCYVC